MRVRGSVSLDNNKSVSDVLNEVVISVNGDGGEYLESDDVEALPRGQKINRLSAENAPASERGVRVLDM